MPLRVDYDRSPNASLEQKFLTLMDSINRAMESLEDEMSKQALSVDLSGIDIGSIGGGGGDGEVPEHDHLINDITDLKPLSDKQVEDMCGFDDTFEGDVIPVATPYVLGCVSVGEGINVDEKGVISTDTTNFEGVISKTLLWENPNPGVAFEAQTVAVDLDEYEEFAVDFINNIDKDGEDIGSGRVVSASCKREEYAAASALAMNGFTMRFRKFSATYANGGVRFGGGAYHNSGATGGANDKNMVPIRIYGIKDVSGYLAKISGVVDSLDDDSTVHALSAAKGKELNDRLDGIADYVVESGNIGIFYYQKWNSGKMEVWGRGTWTLTNYATVNNFYAYYNTINLPVTFTDRPIVHYALQIGSGFSIPSAGFMGVTTTGFNWYGLATAGGTQDCTVTFVVTGKWK